ncbi:hypothetical protein OAO55_01315 [Bacteroidales bacterium]|nr:hypothetical protein [Bacteroidales bacterium]
MKKYSFLIIAFCFLVITSAMSQTDNKKKQLEFVVNDTVNKNVNYSIGIGYTKSLVKNNEFITSKTGNVDYKFLFFLKSGIYYYKAEIIADSTSTVENKTKIASVFITADQKERMVYELDFNR